MKTISNMLTSSKSHVINNGRISIEADVCLNINGSMLT